MRYAALVLSLIPLPALAQEIRAVIVPGRPGPAEDIPSDLVFQTGHTDRVTALAFSADGKTLASAGADKTVRLWNAATGMQRARIAHESAVRAIAFSPDGSRLASGCEDGRVGIQDAASGALLQTLTHEAPVTALAFSPEGGRLLAAGGERGAVRLWDAETGRPLLALAREFYGITAVLFSADGSQFAVATASGDMEIRRAVEWFDARTGRPTRSTAEILRAATADGRWTAVQEGQWAAQTVRVRQAGAGAETCSFSGQSGTVSFSPRGDWVAYSLHPYGELTIRSSADCRVLGTLRGEAWSFEPGAAVSPDGTLAATGAALWDVKEGRMAHSLGPRAAAAVAFSADGKRLATGSNANGGQSLQIWDLVRREELPAPAARDAAIGLAFSPDGRLLAAGTRTITLWDLSTGRALREFQGRGDVVLSPVFSPDGALFAGSSRGLVNVWDARTGAEVLRLGAQDPTGTGSLAFSPDGRLLAAGYSGGVRIYELAAGRALREMPLAGHSSVLAFSRDGRVLAAGTRAQLRLRTGGPTAGLPFEAVPGQGARVAAWNVADGRPLFSNSAGDWVSALSFTRDGRSLLVASGDMGETGSVTLLDAASGRTVRTVIERVDAQGGAAFSPDGAWLAAGSPAGVKLWRTAGL